MDQRERLLAVFNGEKPDIIPWYADLSWWYEGQKRKGKLPEKYEGAEGYLRLYQDTGAGIYFCSPLVWREKVKEGIKIINKREGNKILSRIITPVGEINSVREYLPDSFTYAHKEYFVKNIEDLKIMLHYYQDRIATPSFDDFVRIDKLWNGWGIPDTCAPVCTSPIQNLFTRWAGVETTIYLLTDHQGEFEGLIKELEKCDDQIFEIICGSPAQFVEFPENLSGEITGETLLKKYNLPYLQKRIDQLHKAGKFTLLHNDGTLRVSLPLLAKTELDCVEAVTPAPIGDLSLEEIAEIAKGKLTIWGGLPGVLFSPLYSERYFRNFIKDILLVFPLGSDFILGVADQVPPDAEFSRIALVKEILENNSL